MWRIPGVAEFGMRLRGSSCLRKRERGIAGEGAFARRRREGWMGEVIKGGKTEQGLGNPMRRAASSTEGLIRAEPSYLCQAFLCTFVTHTITARP